ncbi:hypothetical protein [Streptomyces sp. NBC_00687]|uniref:hypothetical protein n=1 Tax=Streptomyces sp. NBC_00687 TaxID=2975807 RepID=UPI00225C2CB7|nr:hypothetical protein [Streptomyces sp. NBC_00687]MCX4919974.1 hypothetical protein [Streptomyces sp. NBC_00687]
MLVFRGPWRTVWTAALLGVVMAGLVHVLACACGPEPGGRAGADSLPLVAMAASAGESATQAASKSPDRPQCTGIDPPVMLDQHLDPAMPEAVSEAAARADEAKSAVAVSGRAGPAGCGNARERERAVLGVWRT